ncbi:MAG: hypothetical protein J1F43_04440 [Muribaculaceae bacterium]|nr:hypothetical protein [Muribaculaceae bacterium]
MKEIGGYFELELNERYRPSLHSDGYQFNSGRHALEFILLSMGSKVKKIYLPYFTCEVVLQPITKLNIPYEFYPINFSLEIDNPPALKEGEYIIFNNYFGIKDVSIQTLALLYKDKIIIDNSQAWYAPEIAKTMMFYSPRKYFGLPDGGIATGLEKNLSNENLYKSLDKDFSYRRFSHLLKRHELSASEGYQDFSRNSSLLGTEPLKKMSDLTTKLLGSIDMQIAKDKRRENFDFLNQHLDSLNKFNLPSLDTFASPLVYPFLSFKEDLRTKLIENKIFVPTYWPNVYEWCDKDSTEYQLTKYLLPIPIDQRYGVDEMLKIIQVINFYGG